MRPMKQPRSNPKPWLSSPVAGRSQGPRSWLLAWPPLQRPQDEERGMLVLELSDIGTRIVSRKTKGRPKSVIDINSMEVLSVLSGYETVRVIVQNKRIIIMPGYRHRQEGAH